VRAARAMTRPPTTSSYICGRRRRLFRRSF
jgi:hypothetical protein